MKGTNTNKKGFGGIIVLILIVLFGYYVTHHEGEKLQTAPSGSKRSTTDSTERLDSEKIPAEMSAKPEIDPNDGAVKIVEEFIKLNAKNPASFEFLEWSEVSGESGYWKVRCKYKGISSFNAEVTTNAWFYIQKNQVVYTKIISKI